MTKTSHKSALIDLLDKARAQTREFEDRLSQAERVAVGEPNHWSVKDVKAHIIVWNDRLAAQLEAAARGERPEQVQDFDEANRQIFEANRARSWEDLLNYEGEVYSRLVAAVNALSEEILDDPDGLEWTNGRPLWWRISFTAFYHALDHLSHLYLEWGDGDLAGQLQEQIAVNMGALDDSQSWQGISRYNLACFYARNTRPEPALELLRHALQLNPGLVDWSKEDADLDSLRGLPAYQALYEG
jgi:tetratricopeptide (TPR) repeat protein